MSEDDEPQLKRPEDEIEDLEVPPESLEDLRGGSGLATSQPSIAPDQFVMPKRTDQFSHH